ncbi:MAG: hypothetical protein G01um101433_91 [Parcubacteria group bacterium Gr01-1014_33]|nr:MAG: hypothetical protein G01um101433_91 [Parcubacteria group bacterium Gr01-1014_33]
MNKELKKIYREDQKDRRNPLFKTDFSQFRKRDLLRKKKLDTLFRSCRIKTGEDYYHAALLYHHNLSTASSKRAVRLARVSIELGTKKALRLYAITIDRLLIKQGKKQKFGTQYRLIKGTWRLYSVDPKTTNTERALYNIPPLPHIRSVAYEDDTKNEIKR